MGDYEHTCPEPWEARDQGDRCALLLKHYDRKQRKPIAPTERRPRLPNRPVPSCPVCRAPSRRGPFYKDYYYCQCQTCQHRFKEFSFGRNE